MDKAVFRHPAPTITEKTAIRVQRGHSMGLIEDGWLLYFEDNETPPTIAVDGKLCIVKTIKGKILTRKVRKGWIEDRWDLLTVNGEQKLNQVLVWAEPVTMIVPYEPTAEQKLAITDAGGV